MFMKRKINIWNRPIIKPTSDAIRYASDLKKTEKTSDSNDTDNPKDPLETKSVTHVTPPPPSTSREEYTPQDPYMNDTDPFAHLRDVEVPERRGRPSILSRKQVRRNTLSISVSEEEELLLRKGATAAGMGFSAWARKILFNSLRRRVPKRPNDR